MCPRIRPLLAATLSLLVVGSADPVAAAQPFAFVSESAVFNPDTQNVLFTIAFNQPPDFTTVDAVGRQHHSFQYFVIGDPSLQYPSNFDAIIRGEEIHVTHDSIRIRNAAPSDLTDPYSGGWGTIRGEVPFTLNGNELTFSVPLKLVSDHSRDGRFDYRLDSYEYGATTNSVTNHSVISSIDHTPPIVTCQVTPGTLWPPNGNFIPVQAAVSVTDPNGSGPAGYTLVSITSNEGNIATEQRGFTVGTASTSGSLQAARAGTGSGRVYTLTYQGRDVAGNTANCATNVTVPHDRGH